MRKFIIPLTLCLLAVGFSSCHKDKRTYTVMNGVAPTAAWGSITATAYEYNSNDERIDSNIIVDPVYMKDYVFTPREEATHIKIKVTSSENTVRWGARPFMLKDNDNIRITVSVTSSYAFNEPPLNEE